MRKQFYFITVISLFLIIFSCKTKQIETQWTDKPITIDGDYSDWEGVPLEYFEDQNIILGAVNDNENLYIMFRFSDYNMAKRIQRMGITLWLDKEGEKNKDYGIRYTGGTELLKVEPPQVNTNPENTSQKQNRRTAMIENLRQKLHLPITGNIIIITGEQEEEKSENQFQGPSAGSTYKDGLFAYEFRLPIPISVKPGEKISLCVELGGLDQSDIDKMQGQKMNSGESSSMSGTGMGGGRGGGMGGGKGGRKGMRSSNQGFQNMEKQNVWINLILAENKNSNE